jgi:hypothetical protein
LKLDPVIAEEDLPHEADFLRRDDQFRERIQNIVEMPDSTIGPAVPLPSTEWRHAVEARSRAAIQTNDGFRGFVRRGGFCRVLWGGRSAALTLKPRCVAQIDKSSSNLIL